MPQQPSNSPGIAGQVSRLKHHSGATAAELRQFIGAMRGKSPQEVLGVLAQSGLVQATALAFAGSIVLLLAMTLLPAMLGDKPVDKAAAKPAAVTPTPAANATTADDKAKTEATTASKDGSAKPATSDKDNVAKKLGINETKTADPKKNPLDNAGDDLFKDIK